MSQQTLSGSYLAIKKDGVKIAFVSSWSVNEENTQTPIEIVDQPFVAEFAFTGHRVSCTLNVFKVDSNAAETIGLRPANIDDMIRQGTFIIECYDRANDKVRYTITGCAYGGGSGSYDARGVFTGNWNIVGQLGGGSL